MRWFRDNIGRGSWLALLALVVNLGLSFGHVHAIEGARSQHVASALSDQHRTQGHPGDSQVDYLCPICSAASALATALASTPPVLRVAFAGVAVDRGMEGVVAVIEPPPAAFQSRGPPIS